MRQTFWDLTLCLDHHADNFPQQLAQACPQGIDIYYENVGGKVFDAVLPLLNTSARIPLCGLVSGYNATALPDGPDRLPLLMATLLKKRIRLQGFIINQDYGHRIHEFQQEMGRWIKEGKIHYREQITDGLEKCARSVYGAAGGEELWQSRDTFSGRCVKKKWRHYVAIKNVQILKFRLYLYSSFRSRWGSLSRSAA